MDINYKSAKNLNYQSVKSLIIAESNSHFEVFLKNTLNRNATYKVSKTYTNGNQLVNNLYSIKENLILIDIHLSILNGLDVIKKIIKSNLNRTILTYSQDYEDHVANYIKSLPNVYYCQKNSIVIKEILEKCILSKIIDYSNYLEEWKNQSKISQNNINIQNKIKKDLSSIEIEIMKLSYQGLSNKKIGELIHLSPRTIDTYIIKLNQKLGVKNKMELIKFCGENKLNNI